MRLEVWGDSITSGYLALRLKKFGANVRWIRSPRYLEQIRIRPYRIGRRSRLLFQELQSSMLRPHYLWKDAEVFQSWSFDDDFPFVPISNQFLGGEDAWIRAKLLVDEIETMAKNERLEIEIRDISHFPSGEFSMDRVVRILDAPPEDLEIFRGKFFPEKMQRKIVYERAWELQFSDSTKRLGTIQYSNFGACRGILEYSSRSCAYLSLLAPSNYALERAELAISDARGAAPMAWKAVYLRAEKSQFVESERVVGLAHLEIPGTFLLGRGIMTPSPWSNLELDYALAQADRIFRKLLENSLIKDPRTEARLWRNAEVSRAKSFLKRTQAAERLLYSPRLKTALSSASMLLPSRLRNYLVLPV